MIYEWKMVLSRNVAAPFIVMCIGMKDSFTENGGSENAGSFCQRIAYEKKKLYRNL